jgi:hypothetical protein
MLSSFSTDSLSALAFGNTDSIEQLSKKGENILKEIKDIEVPEPMVDVHIKALKMAKYTIQLKDEVKSQNTKEDPLGQIAALSKVQGFLGVVSDFSLEIYKKLNEYGIDGIPLNM